MGFLSNVLTALLRRGLNISITQAFQWTGYRKEQAMAPLYTYFKPEEVEGMNEEYVGKLDLARSRTIELDPQKRGVPFIITSGFRTPEKNQSIIGSVPDSSHLKGLGSDLKVDNSFEVFIIVQALQSVGINRIGIYVNQDWQPIHIHNDVDPDKPPYVIFIRGEGKTI